MEYRYFVDFQLGISVFATFSYGIPVLGIPQYPPHSNGYAALLRKHWLWNNRFFCWYSGW